MTFQRSVSITQAIGIPGDFASENPRHSKISAPGGFVAGTGGLTIGLFAWADTGTGTILSNTGTGLPTCFVGRAGLPAMLTTYLQEFGMTIPAGMGVGSMFDGGDFYVVNSGTTATTIGMKAFANLTNGTITFAAAGATVTGSIETKWYCQRINAAGETTVISSTAPG